jgi:hypothetical protein
MFGAVDALSQAHQIDSASTVTLFQCLLEGILGDYQPDEAKQLTQVVLQSSATSEGQYIMGEGGESIQAWIAGERLAPHRLNEMLLEIED